MVNLLICLSGANDCEKKEDEIEIKVPLYGNPFNTMKKLQTIESLLQGEQLDDADIEYALNVLGIDVDVNKIDNIIIGLSSDLADLKPHFMKLLEQSLKKAGVEKTVDVEVR